MRYPSVSKRAPRKSFRNNGGWWKIIITIILALAAIVAIAVFTSGCTPAPATAQAIPMAAQQKKNIVVQIMHYGIDPADQRDWKTNVKVFDEAGNTPYTLVWEDGYEVEGKTGEEGLNFEGHAVTQASLKINDQTFNLANYDIVFNSTTDPSGIHNSATITIPLP